MYGYFSLEAYEKFGSDDFLAEDGRQIKVTMIGQEPMPECYFKDVVSLGRLMEPLQLIPGTKTYGSQGREIERQMKEDNEELQELSLRRLFRGVPRIRYIDIDLTPRIKV